MKNGFNIPSRVNVLLHLGYRELKFFWLRFFVYVIFDFENLKKVMYIIYADTLLPTYSPARVLKMKKNHFD